RLGDLEVAEAGDPRGLRARRGGGAGAGGAPVRRVELLHDEVRSGGAAVHVRRIEVEREIGVPERAGRVARERVVAIHRLRRVEARGANVRVIARGGRGGHVEVHRAGRGGEIHGRVLRSVADFPALTAGSAPDRHVLLELAVDVA